MKIYVASHNQKAARRLALFLRRAGHIITSRWLDRSFGPLASLDEATRRGLAMENFDDVKNSEVLVLIAGPGRPSGGKFIETGYAYGLGKHVLIFGRRENLQCWGNHMVAVETRKQLLDVFARAAAIKPKAV